ncbi:hypothetical protein L873DRAFT_1841203 [Choiromyces venosus 120613-1]|uniref:Uncharacterized protein n=1 Tax=Choiromyces venosus 120613-1 TaxID=1336337 RepID=A0A3N4JZ04_9PEZI|nr:hypothetical protein L873DRAFT_1841203 [Choiromyces venosus 120613-1]
MQADYDNNPQKWTDGSFTIRDRRILSTIAVGNAWEWLHQERKAVIIRSFECTGISLPIDGSRDQEISVKGLEKLEVGDWAIGGLDCNLNRLGKTGNGEIDLTALADMVFEPDTVTDEPGDLDPDLTDGTVFGEYVQDKEVELEVGLNEESSSLEDSFGGESHHQMNIYSLLN